MLKKLLLYVSLFYLLLFHVATPSYAFLFGLKTNAFDNLYGFTCGVPNSSYNRCCQDVSAEVDYKQVGIVSRAMSPVTSVVSSVTNTVLRSITNIPNIYWGSTGDGKRASACLNSLPSTPDDIHSPSCRCIVPANQVTAGASLCNGLKKKPDSNVEYNSCVACVNGQSGKNGIWTSFGCVYGDMTTFIEQNVFGWGMGLAGTLSMLCIIYSAIQIQLSRGNAEKVKKSQEMATSCVMGLILIIFSVFILRVIGVDILKLPGFGR